MSSINSNHNAEVVGKAFPEIPTHSILDKFTAFFTHNSDSKHLEQHTATLTFFRSFSEEQNENIMQLESELNDNLQENADMNYGKALTRSNGNNVCITVMETGNGSDATGEEDSNRLKESEVGVNEIQCKQSMPRTTQSCHMEERSVGKRLLCTGEHNDKVDSFNAHSFSIDDSPDDSVFTKSVQTKSQHISADCANTDCDCVLPVSVNLGEMKEHSQRAIKAYGILENLDYQEQSGSYAGDVDVPDMVSPNSVEESAMNGLLTLTTIGSAVQEQADSGVTATPTLELATEQNGVPLGFTRQDEEDVISVEEDNEEDEKRVIFQDSTTFHHPPGTLTRATFSPGSPTDKQIQLPAFFSGLRVLRKGVSGPEHDTVAQIKPSSQGARWEIFPEPEKKPGDSKAQGSFLDHISQLLSREKRGDDSLEGHSGEAEEERGDTGEKNEACQDGENADVSFETEVEAEASGSPESIKTLSSAEAAFDAFKAFFTPKPLKKDPAEKIDLEAVRKRIRTDADGLRALSERNANKTPVKKEPSDGQVCIML